MPQTPAADDASPVLEAHLLGRVDFEQGLALQNRLVFEASGRGDRRVDVLLCEHPAVLTVGRRGSRGHIDFTPRDLASRQLRVVWVNHGGGCLIHLPGQLAVYPIVPLDRWGLPVLEYVHRLHQALARTLGELGIAAQLRPELDGLWGRTGQLAAVAVAVKWSTAYFGAWINVSNPLDWFRWVRSDPYHGSPMSSLDAERRQAIRMTQLRAALVGHLAAVLGCQRYHVYTGHPLVAPRVALPREAAPRAG
jgi:lipoyl(octanoyl) transferase